MKIDSQIKNLLNSHNQSHILQFWDDLTDIEKGALVDQIKGINWDEITRWIGKNLDEKSESMNGENLQPAPYYPVLPEGEKNRELYAKAEKIGSNLIQNGKVAVFTVAGGQSTRLGYPSPKGTYPISPIKQKTLFQLFAESLQRYNEIYHTNIPWYIMTSPATDQQTKDYFSAHNYFGLNVAEVMIFMQGTLPALEFNGKCILAEKSKLAISPDGHGGSIRALCQSGAIEDMRKRGIDHISYFQVDNPLVTMIDPLFLGLHSLTDSDMSSKCIAKAYASEKMGVFCTKDGRLCIIEYTELPDHHANELDPDGRLRFIAGSLAIHVLKTAFVDQLNEGEFQLPFHHAEKKNFLC